MRWVDDLELAGKNAIVLARKRVYADSPNEYEYQLLQLFRLDEASNWSVDCPLNRMSADNFNPRDYDGLLVIDNGAGQ